MAGHIERHRSRPATRISQPACCADSLQENAALETRLLEPAAAPNVVSEAASPALRPRRAGQHAGSWRAQKVLVRDCIPNPFNPRVFYSESSLHELALTLKREGQIEPIRLHGSPSFRQARGDRRATPAPRDEHQRR